MSSGTSTTGTLTDLTTDLLMANNNNNNKQIWICDICHRQIHVRKQISIRYNRIEHCMHLRCVGIRLAQFTDTWTGHLHNESILTTHINNTTLPNPGPSHPSTTPPTPHNPNTDTCHTLPLFLQDWYIPKRDPLTH